MWANKLVLATFFGTRGWEKPSAVICTNTNTNKDMNTNNHTNTNKTHLQTQIEILTKKEIKLVTFDGLFPLIATEC